MMSLAAMRDGHNGLLLPPKDTPALIAALERCAADPGFVRQMGAQARADFLAGSYSLDAVAAALDAVFREAHEHTQIIQKSF